MSEPTFDTDDMVVAAMLFDDSSEDEATSFNPMGINAQLLLMLVLAQIFDEDERPAGGSVIGRKHVNRDRQAAHERLINDYFSENPRFDGEFFRRRFRMRSLFNKILRDITADNPFFPQKRDATFRLGLTPHVKMTTAMRMLSYACTLDTLDEWLKIADSTTIECLMQFCETIVKLCEEEFLRQPNETNIARLLEKGAERGFPSMLVSLDCMLWVWKNCPVAWKGQLTGHTHESTLILEAVAYHEMWIWHCFFGMARSHNDLNVLENSHLFDCTMNGNAPPCNYTISGVQYNMGYYLADGIYPDTGPKTTKK